MTPEKQRLIIALAIGAKKGRCGKNTIVTFEPLIVASEILPDTHIIDGKKITFAPNVPDYPRSLDAMHEVEKTILSDHAQWCAYTVELEILMEDIGPLIHATAAQKSEAYLKAIGKWEEQA